jgi:hypothetical protein
MREELAKIHGCRRLFEGVFDRFGVKSGYKGPLKTVCLLNIHDVVARKVVTDHLWFTMGKRFDRLNLQKGDVVRFEARVTIYEKGYRRRQDEDDFDYKPLEYDYRLSFPTKIMKFQPLSPSQAQLV